MTQITVSNVLGGNIKDIAVSVTMTKARERKIRALAQSIDVTSPLSISAFGSDLGRHVHTATDSVLATARNGDMDDMGAKLSEMVLLARSFRFEALDNRLLRLPLIGGIITAVLKSKAKAMSHFETIERQIEHMVEDVSTVETTLLERSETLESMYRSVVDEQELLALHVLAAESRLIDLRIEIGSTGHNSDPLKVERSGQLEASGQALGKRRDDLKVLHHAAQQTLPMIRMIQANNLVLVEKFRTIQTLTLPTWKRAFLMALALDEQKNAVALANNIDDATNYFMKRNAELLHENAVATARASQRLIVDVGTLRAVHSNIIATLDDVRAVHQEGARDRAAAMDELSGLKSEMALAIGNVRLATDAKQLA